jgi:hypothetical protein
VLAFHSDKPVRWRILVQQKNPLQWERLSLTG